MAASKNKKIAVVAALGALTVFLGITRLGFFPWFSGVTITILHIPPIIAALLEGPLAGMAVGGIFGVFSLFQANIGPISPLDLAFRNPLVSVLPRMLYPFIAAVLYRLLRKKPLRAAAIAAVTSTFIHTVLVLGTIWLTKGSGAFGLETNISVFVLIAGVLITNGIPEALVAAFISVAIIALRLNISKRKTAKILDDDDKEN